MNRQHSIAALCSAVVLCLAGTGGAASGDVDLKGFIEPEVRWFTEDPSDPRQTGGGLSLALEATLEIEWARGDHNIVITPFGRIDREDKNRQHFDLRKARYEAVFDRFELRIGLDKVYWGVTEFAHLVDIINQTDQVESIDGEEKLGQPMINLTVPTGFGTFDFFVLPLFRERTFPGVEGRPRTDLVVSGTPTWEHEDGDQHLDTAVRWSHYIGDIDIGLSWFDGTGRDPVFTGLDLADPQMPLLVPHYIQIQQGGLDIQATLGAWLWKFEGFVREETGTRTTWGRAAGGFEYSIYGLGSSAADLGIVAEYLYDDRGQSAPQPFNNDIFAGLRLAFNDEQSTALLAGLGRDLDTDALTFRIEAERRLGADYFLTAELQILSDIPATSPLASFADDNYLQIRLARYF